MPRNPRVSPSTAPASLTDLDNKQPIDEADPLIREVMRRLQGNILKGHGRDYGVYIFLAFGDDLAAVRKQMSEMTERYVTSALRQHREAEDYRNFRIPGYLFGSLLLTAHGYRKLELSPEDLFKEDPETFGNTQSSFAEGLRTHAVADFNDPPVGQWQIGYRENIDAMLLLADDDEGHLLREARKVMTELARHNTVLVAERGKALRNADEEGIEHFGYVDGRSQPLYLKSDFTFDAAGNRVAEKGGGPIDRWDPFEPLRRVLITDPGVTGEANCFGSYMVFRKLEQDVLHFKMREQELADVLKFEGEERERAGAMAVGRFEDGTPVTLSKTDGFRPAKENNFTYKDDPDGHKCPFHAHIRKSNPRGDIPNVEAERKRRITRRGITFGEREKHPGKAHAIHELPANSVGLLFMCFQASIRHQFAFMQKAWCNAPDFRRPGTGLDPVIGQASATGTNPQNWSKEYGQAPGNQFAFEHFVRMKGGEYFFAPSIPFLTNLGKSTT